MRCHECREILSARLDDAPVADLEATAADAHVTACADCRIWLDAAAGLHRAMRVRPVEPVPDLTGAILAAAPPMVPAGSVPPARPAPRFEWARYVLFAVALTRLILALPAMLLGEGAGASIHVARELGSWDIALAVGLLVVALRPSLAKGMLAFALTLAGATLVTAVLDVVSGRAPAAAEATHVIDLVAVALVWLVARTGSAPARVPAVAPAT
jgi:predicted anti-sigma-YlaC factor YlaD